MSTSSTPENVITPISELIKQLKPLLDGGEISQVYNILVNRESKVNAELENLEKSRNVMKEVCRSLERKHSFIEIEKFKLSDLLMRSERECEELKENIVRLREEVKKSSDRVKWAEDRYANVCKDEHERSAEKIKTFFELTKKLDGLRNAIRERDQMGDELKCIHMKVDEMGVELLELRGQKLAADETIDRMRREKLKVDQIMEELRCQNLEASEAMEELRGRNLEASAATEKLKCIQKKVGEMGMELLELRGQKLAADETIDQMRRERLEVDQIMEELSRRNLEASEAMKELKCIHKKMDEMGIELLELQGQKSAADETINQMRREKLEVDQTMEELRYRNLEDSKAMEELKCIHKKVDEMGMELLELQGQKLAANETINQMRREKLEVDQIMEELRRRNSEDSEAMEELRLRNSEASKAMEELRRQNLEAMEELRCQNPEDSEAIQKLKRQNIEASETIEKLRCLLLAAEMNKKMSDQTLEELKRQKMEANEVNKKELQSLRATISRSDEVYEVAKKKFESLVPRFTRVEEGLHSMRERYLQTDVVIEYLESEKSVEDAMHSNCQSGLPKKGTGDSDLGLNDKVPITELKMSEAGCSGKMLHSSPACGVIIEIYDSDDECNPGGEECDLDIGSDVDVKEMSNEKLVQAPSSQTNKRNTTDWTDSSLMSSSPKRKRSARGSVRDNLPSRPLHALASTRASDTQTPLPKLDGFSDGLSTDSEEESCSDSHMDDLLADLRRKKHSRKWMCRADMLKAFEEDAELCMNAVCALYRQQFLTEKSAPDSNMCKSGGFSHIDALSGCALAEYLIDGDPELRLRKTVSEVQQQRPDVLSGCKRLANIYQERLFEIYWDAGDPFFGQT